jgi:crotonobetainyl-CoA:carnitine CoA-transferase CaiB-like acyl-CoA transferase
MLGCPAVGEGSDLPLAGIRVVSSANALPTAVVGQLLADAGAEVWLLEPPDGSRLRPHAAWGFWARGQRSLRVALSDEADRRLVRDLVARSDVFVDGWGSGVAARLGLAADDLCYANARLVHARISAFGDDSPYAALEGWEPVVMAVLGGATSFSNLTSRPGPSFVSAPFCSVSAAHLAVQGILGALVERERSGRGQRVGATLAQGLLSFDTWNWLLHVLAERYSSSFTMAPAYDYERLVPNTPFFFRLLVGLSKDGQWMQFSQTTERLYTAFLRACGLDPEDPAVLAAGASEDDAVRVAFWEQLLAAVRSRTVDEWMAVFDADPDVWADQYRVGAAALEHPQLVADGRVIADGDGGRVPGALALASAWPALTVRPAPVLGADDADARRLVAEVPAVGTGGGAGSSLATGPDDAPTLDGITVIELGTFYAAPFGATLLAEQGARVIKIEAPEGDPIRNVLPFPELAGVKVLHGKESVVVDLGSPDGRAALAELVRRADVVLQGFRAGVVDRMGCSADELLAINPDLVYVSAPGYGDGPPCGHRPAFAPTMGAASGLAIRNVGGPQAVLSGPDLDLDDVKRTAMRLATGAMGGANADGFAALGVATTMLLGIVGHVRHGGGNVLRTSMLSTMALALADSNVVGAAGAPTPAPDGQLLGLGPWHRLYETADGWVTLAVTDAAARTALAATTGIDVDGDGVAAALEAVFRTAPATEWQDRLVPQGITCVAVAPEPFERTAMLGPIGVEHGYVTTGVHATLDEYPRLTALTTFSRSRSVLGAAPLCGDHTESVLAELGQRTEAR